MTPEAVPSQATNSTPEDAATSPRSTSLAAAATINAGTQAQDGRQGLANSSRGSASVWRTGVNGERRRSNVGMNINLNDPALPAPGEMQNSTGENRPPSRTFRTASPQTISRSPSMRTDPHHHHRAPSIGELHQELEQEQEAQVNRLLQTIRQQQSQIQALQARVGTPVATGTDSPTSERSLSFSTASNTRTRSPVPTVIRSRRHSQTSPAPPHAVPSSIAHSHSIPPADESAILPSGGTTPIGVGGGAIAGASGAGRDETAYWQAESQALTRENQILKTRIKELERQLSHSHSSQSSTSSNPAAPAVPSNLALRGAGD